MNIGSQDNSVTILIIIWAERNVSLLHNILTGSSAYPAFCLIPTGDFTVLASDWDIKLTTNLHLVAEVKNVWSYKFNFSCTFIVGCRGTILLFINILLISCHSDLVSNPDQSIWKLGWIKWHWDIFSSKSISLSFHEFSLPIHSFINDTVIIVTTDNRLQIYYSLYEIFGIFVI
jgi:hypothetical protein